MKIRALFQGFVAAALFLCSGAVQAWDGMGHLLIDEIAYENVTPAVRARVDALARLLDSKRNDHKPYNFVTIGCYMDDARANPGYLYSTWHYIDIPYTPNGTGFRDEPSPNVLWALQQSVETLRNSHPDDAAKALALAMIMHFEADIHQPLHCVDWNDKGGNGYFIAGIPFKDFSKKQVPNLHAFWDRAYRYDEKDGKAVELYTNPWPAQRPGISSGGPVQRQAKKIMDRYPLSGFSGIAKIDDPSAWVLESYRLGCLLAYPRGRHPTDHEFITLSPWFVGQAHDVANRRIALAGYRLANLLNALLGSQAASGK